MAENKAEPGDGTLSIELDGKVWQMEPTWDRCMAISKMHGGCAVTAQRCLNLDAETICQVIGISCGFNPIQMQKQVGPAIFNAGLMDVASKCVDFINVVTNGGRLPPEDGSVAEGLDGLVKVVRDTVSSDAINAVKLATIQQAVTGFLILAEEQYSQEDQETEPDPPQPGSPSGNSIES